MVGFGLVDGGRGSDWGLVVCGVERRVKGVGVKGYVCWLRGGGLSGGLRKGSDVWGLRGGQGSY